MQAQMQKTPLYAAHQRLGARMMPFAGFEMPVQYSSIRAEHEAVRERAGLFDVSHMGQIHFSGPRANEAAEELVTCEIDSLRVGRARYGLMLNENAGCVDDVMVTREADDALFFCVNASNIEKDLAWILKHTGPDVSIENRSAETALLALQGPAASSIMTKIASPGASLPGRFRVARLSLEGVEVLVSGTGYTGSPGFELYLPGTHAEMLFERLLAVGEEDGLLPAGLGARDTLRLEAALALYGHELDDATSPFEAGLDRFVKDLERGFIGAEALAGRPRTPDSPQLIGFELIGRGVARADYEIMHAGQTVGRVTSGAPSPTLGKSIGLGYVPKGLSEVGQTLSVQIRTKTVEARVVELPFLR